MSGANRELHVTQGLINAWATLSGDFNPLHVDPTYASSTRFGGTIAHGHLALALMQGLLLDVAGERWVHAGHLHDVRFAAPLRPGRTYSVAVHEIEQNVWSLRVTERGGDEMCALGSARLTEHGDRR